MSFLYVGCKKFPTNQFVGNFYPMKEAYGILYIKFNKLRETN